MSVLTGDNGLDKEEMFSLERRRKLLPIIKRVYDDYEMIKGRKDDCRVRKTAFNNVGKAGDSKENDSGENIRNDIRKTGFGLFGTSNIDDVFLLFEKIRAYRFRSIVDLGAGDGRVVAVAGLFSRAKGIEGDEELVSKGKDSLSIIKQLIREKESGFSFDAELVCNNYYNEDLSGYDLIFMYPDNPFDDRMVEKLVKEFKGYLLVYDDTYQLGRVLDDDGLPVIVKGKTYWVGQRKVVSYCCNVPNKNLELE